MPNKYYLREDRKAVVAAALTTLWEEARERHTPVGKYYDVWTNSETDCIQKAVEAILAHATPQPVTGEDISFAELKWNIGSLFNQNIKMSDNGKAIEGNPAVHAIAEYVHNLLAASRPSDAVELIKAQEDYIQFLSNESNKYVHFAGIHGMKVPQEVFDEGQRHRDKIANLKSPNPNK